MAVDGVLQAKEGGKVRTDHALASGQQRTTQCPLGIRPAIDADKAKVTEGVGSARAEHTHAPISQHEAAGEIQGEKQAAIEARAVIGRLQSASHGFRFEDLLAFVIPVIEKHLKESTGFFGGGIEVTRRHDDVLKAVIIGDFHYLIDAASHRIGQKQIHQFHGHASGYIPGTFRAGLAKGKVFHAHGLANYPIQGGIKVLAGNRLDNGAEDKAGGNGMVGLIVEARRFGRTQQIDDFLGAVKNIRFHLGRGAGDTGLMGLSGLLQIEAEAQRQAAMIGMLGDFHYMAIGVLLGIPLLLLLKPVKHDQPDADEFEAAVME